MKTFSRNPSMSDQNPSQALTVHHENMAVSAPLTLREIKDQVNLIQQVMRDVMVDGEHYGTIPGTNKDKKSLLKPGAEKLCLTFRFAPSYELTKTDLGGGHVDYEMVCTLRTIQSGTIVGQGLGSCNTREKKYLYRPGPVEFTGQPVPQAYWDMRKSNPKQAQESIGGVGFAAAKNPENGFYEIAIKGETIEHDNPADYYNTCLKMCTKRALVAAILTATAASDIFVQDLDDDPDDLPEDAKPKPEAKTTPAKKTEPAKDAPKDPLKEPAKAPEGKAPEAAGGWKEVAIHFGKNKGIKLGALEDNSLNWYIENFEPKEYNGKFQQNDLDLRAALNQAANELEQGANKNNEPPAQ